MEFLCAVYGIWIELGLSTGKEMQLGKTFERLHYAHLKGNPFIHHVRDTKRRLFDSKKTLHRARATINIDNQRLAANGSIIDSNVAENLGGPFMFIH